MYCNTCSNDCQIYCTSSTRVRNMLRSKYKSWRWDIYIYVHVYIFNEFNHKNNPREATSREPRNSLPTKYPTPKARTNEIQRYSKNNSWSCEVVNGDDAVVIQAKVDVFKLGGARRRSRTSKMRRSESELDCAETDLVTAAARQRRSSCWPWPGSCRKNNVSASTSAELSI